MEHFFIQMVRRVFTSVTLMWLMLIHGKNWDLLSSPASLCYAKLTACCSLKYLHIFWKDMREVSISSVISGKEHEWSHFPKMSNSSFGTLSVERSRTLYEHLAYGIIVLLFRVVRKINLTTHAAIKHTLHVVKIKCFHFYVFKRVLERTSRGSFPNRQRLHFLKKL